MRCLQCDDKGTTSFAVLGVLIVLLSIFATAHISHLERLNFEERMMNDILTKMDNGADEYLDSIDTKLQMLGIKAAFDGNRGGEDIANSIFEEESEDYLEGILDDEKRDGTLSLTLKHHNVTMDKMLLEVDDISPIGLDDVEEDGLRTDGPGDPVRTDRTYAYEIKGTLEVLVRDSRRGTELTKDRDVEITVDVPYPFMKEKTDSFRSAATGNQGHVGRMVEYVLTTVAQYRAFTDFDLKDGQILTGEDVELAVNLALILEIAYQYRYFEMDATEALSQRASGYEHIDAGEMELFEIVEHYIDRGRVDPGDIVSLYQNYAYDNETRMEDEVTPLDLENIVEQALYALVDQFILNYLDYFGIIDLADAVFNAARKLVDIATEVGGRITGFLSGFFVDEDEEREKYVDMVQEWVEEIFAASGLTSTNIARPIYHPINKIGGEKILGYPRLPDDFEHEFTFESVVRLTGDDHRWYMHDCDHGEPYRGRKGTLCNVTIEQGVPCNAEERLVGYEHKIYEINVTIGPGQVSFQEVDIFDVDTDIWYDFFEGKYDEGVDEEINSIRDAVREVVEKIVGAVTEAIGDDLFDEFSRVEIDVGDDRSLLHDIRDAVKDAVTHTFEHLRNNPDDIEEIVYQLLFADDDSEAENLELLKRFLLEEYDEMCDRDSYIDDATDRTAERMVSPESTQMNFEVNMMNSSMGDLDDHVDFTWNTEQNFPRSHISHMVQDHEGYDDFLEDLSTEVDIAYEVLRAREVQNNPEEEYNENDGLLIQALDHYYFEKHPSHEGVRSHRVSTMEEDGIESIEPNPATMGVDTVYFNSTTSPETFKPLWRSDIDRRLSCNFSFSMPSEDLTPGRHNISFTWLDDEMNPRTDYDILYINRPPTAKINETGPGWELGEINFTHSSTDPDGYISKAHWDFGDGNTAVGDEVTHVYQDPGVYNVTLTVYDDMNASDTDHIDLLIDDRPRVVSVEPDTGEPVETNTMFRATFSEPVDPDSLVYSVDPYIKFDDHWDAKNMTVSFEPDDFFDRSRSYTLSILEVRDVDNGTASPLLERFDHDFETVDHARLIETHPEGENIPVNRDVVLNFSESVKLVGSVDDLISGDYDWTFEYADHNRAMILSHSTPFPRGEKVELFLNLGAIEARSDGNTVKSHVGNTISFETQDVSYPELISTVPVKDEFNVQTCQDIALQFDRSINISSFEFSLTPEPDGVTLNWSDDNKSLIISHNGFMGDTLYSVSISGEDLGGRPIVASLENSDVSTHFEFRTEEVVSPIVLHHSPKSGNERFLSGAPITLMFNKEVDPSSISFNMEPFAGEADVMWDDLNTIAFIDFDDYEPGEEYEFELKNVKDLHGNGLEEELTIKFQISSNDDQIEGTRFERVLATIIGRGVDTFGGAFLTIGESFIKRTVENMVVSSDFSNLEYRVPLETNEPFVYGDSGELEFRAELYPSTLHIKDKVEISYGYGTHYTDITSISSRPYETHWDVIVPNTTAYINVSREGDDVLVDGGHEEVWLNESIDVGFSLDVTVSSGWALLDEEHYEISHDIIGTVVNFMNQIWGYIQELAGHAMSAVQRILELFDSLVERVKEFAEEIIGMLGEMIKEVVERLLMPLADWMMDGVKGNLEAIDSVLSLLGLDFLVDIDPDGTSIQVPFVDEKVDRYLGLSLESELFGTSYSFNLNLLCSSVIAFGHISVRDMTFQWGVDPFGAPFVNDTYDLGVYDAWFKTSGESGGGSTSFELRVPVEDDSEDMERVTIAEYTPIDHITIPIGPVVVSNMDVGMEFTHHNVSGSTVTGLLKTAFQDTSYAMRDTALGLDYVVEFVRTLVRNILDGFINFAREFIEELYFFFSATINEVKVKMFFGVFGGEAVSNFVEWVAISVRELLDSMVNMRPSLPKTGPPRTTIENTYLGVEAGRDLMKGYFNANVPAIAAAVGRDMGEWELGFGMKTEGYYLVKGTLTGGG